MSKTIHQFFLGVLIVNLILILVLIKLPVVKFILCSASLVSLLILPFGKKGGIYHIVLSTIGLAEYTSFMLIDN